MGGRASESVSSALEWSLRDFIFPCLEDAVRVATCKLICDFIGVHRMIFVLCDRLGFGG